MIASFRHRGLKALYEGRTERRGAAEGMGVIAFGVATPLSAACIAALALSLGPIHLAGQEPSTVTGRVLDLAGRPLASADAFLLETLEGALTDLAGAFSFTTGATGPASWWFSSQVTSKSDTRSISPSMAPSPS